jgi:hypothetical protein
VVINGSAASISKILSQSQIKSVYLIYRSQLSIRPCNTPYESSSAESDSPSKILTPKESYRTTIYSNLASGTLVSLLRNLLAEATYLLGEFSIKSALNRINHSRETYENNLASFL